MQSCFLVCENNVSCLKQSMSSVLEAYASYLLKKDQVDFIREGLFEVAGVFGEAVTCKSLNCDREIKGSSWIMIYPGVSIACFAFPFHFSWGLVGAWHVLTNAILDRVWSIANAPKITDRSRTLVPWIWPNRNVFGEVLNNLFMGCIIFLSAWSLGK